VSYRLRGMGATLDVAPLAAVSTSAGPCFSLPNLLTFSTVSGTQPLDTSRCIGPFSLATWAIIGGVAWLLFSSGGSGRGRRMNPARKHHVVGRRKRARKVAARAVAAANRRGRRP